MNRIIVTKIEINEINNKNLYKRKKKSILFDPVSLTF